MSDAGILFLALLAVLCQIFLVTCLILKVGSRFSGNLGRGWSALADAAAPVALPFAFAVAAVTVAGSLYLSEVKNFVPCLFCWVQRALLYPLVLLTAIAALANGWRKWARRLAITLAAIDIPVSVYHVLLERYPTLETSACSLSTPCSLVYVKEFGYLTTPGMALTSAITVIVLLLLSRRVDPDRTPQENANG